MQRRRPPVPTTPASSEGRGASTRPSSGVSYLTAAGRHLLEGRIVLLEAKVAELADALHDTERRADVVEEYCRSSHELGRLRVLLDSAEVLDDLPDDPRVVELGDRVSIRLDDGREETYVVVHAAEAAVDDARISAQSPLGHALLGRRVGETVRVTVPGTPYRCTILSANRRDPGGDPRAARSSDHREPST